jgi:predicted metal-dependent phosphoesterase TrpH
MLTSLSSESNIARRVLKGALSLEAKRLLETFQGLHKESCPYHYNFHMHTTHSDGQLSPQTLIEQAIDIGLKGLAITDHHSVGGYWAVREWMQSQRWRRGNSLKMPRLWAGVEITAQLLGIDVHILGYGFDPEHTSLRPYLQGRSVKGAAFQAEAIVQAIQEAGGLVVLAHPARYRLPPEVLIREMTHYGLDGVEAYYAYDNPSPWRSSPVQTAKVLDLAQQYQLLRTCGTDTHGLNLLQRL